MYLLMKNKKYLQIYGQIRRQNITKTSEASNTFGKNTFPIQIYLLLIT